MLVCGDDAYGESGIVLRSKDKLSLTPIFKMTNECQIPL